VAQLVECLASKYEALRSNSSTAKKQTKTTRFHFKLERKKCVLINRMNNFLSDKVPERLELSRASHPVKLILRTLKILLFIYLFIYRQGLAM
jgi:hypothetical protein